MTVENCSNCVFGLEREKHGLALRHCHKHPPIVFEGVTGGHYTSTGVEGFLQLHETRGPVTAWPQVRDDDFCGEFELKDAS